MKNVFTQIKKQSPCYHYVLKFVPVLKCFQKKLLGIIELCYCPKLEILNFDIVKKFEFVNKYLSIRDLYMISFALFWNNYMDMVFNFASQRPKNNFNVFWSRVSFKFSETSFLFFKYHIFNVRLGQKLSQFCKAFLSIVMMWYILR